MIYLNSQSPTALINRDIATLVCVRSTGSDPKHIKAYENS